MHLLHLGSTIATHSCVAYHQHCLTSCKESKTSQHGSPLKPAHHHTSLQSYMSCTGCLLFKGSSSRSSLWYSSAGTTWLQCTSRTWSAHSNIQELSGPPTSIYWRYPSHVRALSVIGHLEWLVHCSGTLFHQNSGVFLVMQYSSQNSKLFYFKNTSSDKMRNNYIYPTFSQWHWCLNRCH